MKEQKNILDIIKLEHNHDYLLEFFPDFDYHKLQLGIDPFRLKYDKAVFQNIVGQQQRCFAVYWAIKMCSDGNLGLDIGSAGVRHPWVIASDYYSGDHHPAYDGPCKPMMVLNALDLSLFGDECFKLILALHVLEHIEGDVVQCMKGWLRVLQPEGIIGTIIPSNTYRDTMKEDKSHTHAWTEESFYTEIVEPLLSAGILELVEYDTLDNEFSINCVMKKVKKGD